MTNEALKTLFLKLLVNKANRDAILRFRKTHGIPDDGFKSEEEHVRWISRNEEPRARRLKEQNFASNEILKIAHKWLPKEATASFISAVAYPDSFLNADVPLIRIDRVNSKSGKEEGGVILFIPPDISQRQMIKFIDKNWKSIRILLGPSPKRTRKGVRGIDHKLFYMIYTLKRQGMTMKQIAKHEKIAEYMKGTKRKDFGEESVGVIWKTHLKQWIEKSL